MYVMTSKPVPAPKNGIPIHRTLTGNYWLMGLGGT